MQPAPTSSLSGRLASRPSAMFRPDSSVDTMPPLRFAPIYKRLIWGGRRLESVLGRHLDPGSDYAESWELADHRDDVSRVCGGPLDGRSLRDLIREDSGRLLGAGLAPGAQFPLLVKFLDAHQNLSVQVHPQDALARELSNDNGKTEAWVVVHAEPGSLIYAGLRPGVTRERFTAALAEGTVEPLLHRFEAQKGDCVFLPAGTVHALGAGVMVAEVQQMSDATFRIDDWGRVGPDGTPRTLHIREALAAIDFEAGPVDPIRTVPISTGGGVRERLVQCPYFSLERLTLAGPSRLGRTDRFTILIGLGGSARVCSAGGELPIGFGQTLLLPADTGSCEIVPDGSVCLLSCSVP